MRARISIGGMTCAACSSSVERALSNLDGVRSAAVNLAMNTADVDFDDDVVTIQQLEEVIEDTGFDVIRENDEKDNDWSLYRLIVAAVFTIPLLYISMGHMMGLPVPSFIVDDPKVMCIIQLVLCIPVVLAGSGFYVRGYPNLFRLRPNMDTLVALGTTAALLYSIYQTVNVFNGHGDAHSLYYESAATIITLVMVGKYLETRSKHKTGEAVRKLIELAPQEARVIRNGEEVTIRADEVVIDDVMIIRPGERVPADGVVISGATSVDESMLTGESIYSDKEEGSRMYAATVNMNGTVKVRAELVGTDTMLSQIVRMIEDAQSSKAPVARLADTVAGYFVPAVMAIAVAACMVWLIAGKDIEFSLTVLISVLVIACPCALGLATPLAIIVGTGKGAEHGILFKDATSLEISGRVDTILLDKTGTITEGRPQVTDVISDDIPRLVYLAASAESSSEHPLGKAVIGHAAAMDIKITEPTGFKAHIGNGIECVVDGVDVMIGNAAFMERVGVDISAMIDDISRLTAQGKTTMIVSAGSLLGIIAVSDVIKPSSATAVRSMEEMDINTIMVTGDGRRTAEAIASEVGIGTVIADTLPGGKSDVVADLRSKGHVVAMVGDGINDAPALALSDVGMAVGSGTDIAIGSADVVLMNNDLRSVPAAIEIGRATLGNVKQNLFFAFCYNIVGIPIAAGLLYVFGGPLLNPMIAAGAMSLSSISVVLNALRLRNFRPKAIEQTF